MSRADATTKYLLYVNEADAGGAAWCPCWVFEHTDCDEPRCACPRYCGLRLEVR